MKILLLIVLLLLLPLLLGKGAAAFSGKNQMKWPLQFVTGAILLLCICGVSHGASFVLHRDLAFCTKIFTILLLVAATLSYVLILIKLIRSYLQKMSVVSGGDSEAAELRNNAANSTKIVSPAEPSITPRMIILGFGLFLMIFSQLLLAGFGAFISCTGDQTLETVNSFLASGNFYDCNPLTGLAQTTGIPSRLRILCLPTFYAILCRTFSVSPQLLLWHIMPVFWLICCYLIYWELAKVLWENSEKRMLFLFLISVFFYASLAIPGLDGYGLLMAGWTATTLRATILIPYLLTSLLSRRFIYLLLPIAAEAMILWTLAGTGAGFLIFLGILGVYFAMKGIEKRRIK